MVLPFSLTLNKRSAQCIISPVQCIDEKYYPTNIVPSYGFFHRKMIQKRKFEFFENGSLTKTEKA